MKGFPQPTSSGGGSDFPVIQVEMELHATFKNEPGRLAGILEVLRRRGGALKAHLLYRLGDQSVGFFLCQNPTEGALALQRDGISIETETVVTVLTEDRPGTLAHLARTLEAEGIAISYGYSAAASGALLAVMHTDDNPRAEDVIRNFLVPAEAPDDRPALSPGGPREQNGHPGQ